MSEPLKDKSTIVQDNNCKLKNLELFENMFYKRDVASAVEWLKEQLDKIDMNLLLKDQEVKKLIDEAFSDVIKNDS